VKDSNSDKLAHNELVPEEKVQKNIASAEDNCYTDKLDIETHIIAFKEDYSFNEENFELDGQLEKLIEKSEGF